MLTFTDVVEGIGLVIDGAGVLAIVLGLLVASLRFAAAARRAADGYRQYRQDLGRGILLGLELLVAADIIRTVAVAPTLQGVLVLGLIVLIRTFLSMALQVEVEGRWPWQQVNAPSQRSVPDSETAAALDRDRA
jgi:uncharacterized membrane protein